MEWLLGSENQYLIIMVIREHVEIPEVQEIQKQIKWDTNAKILWKIRKIQYFEEIYQNILSPKFSCLKLRETWIYGTLKSVFDSYDDSCT